MKSMWKIRISLCLKSWLVDSYTFSSKALEALGICEAGLSENQALNGAHVGGSQGAVEAAWRDLPAEMVAMQKFNEFQVFPCG